MPDFINVYQLEVFSAVGVYAKEQLSKQRLTVTLQLNVQSTRAAAKFDDVKRPVDYGKVCATVKKVATERPRKLIETLAEEMASTLLRQYPIKEITLEIEKFILPDTRSVSVKIT